MQSCAAQVIKAEFRAKKVSSNLEMAYNKADEDLEMALAEATSRDS